MPHISEIYICNICQIEYKLFDVDNIWICPLCKRPISIRFKTDKFDFSCHRLHPNELKIGMPVILDRENFHEVLNISQDNDNFRIALAKYGVINKNIKDYLFVILGSWI